jgi:hypothetical protein
MKYEILSNSEARARQKVKKEPKKDDKKKDIFSWLGFRVVVVSRFVRKRREIAIVLDLDSRKFLEVFYEELY